MGATIWIEMEWLVSGIGFLMVATGDGVDAIRHEQRDGPRMAPTGDLTRVNLTVLKGLESPGDFTGGY